MPVEHCNSVRAAATCVGSGKRRMRGDGFVQKKRAAQVLRLRCQIKERSDRHRRLREQYNILQGTLASLQQHQLEALK